MVIMVPLQPNPWSKLAGHPDHSWKWNQQISSYCCDIIHSRSSRYITVEQATSDADTFVSTSLELADSGKAVVLVGTDADFLIMLVDRTPPDAKLFLLRPSMNAKPAKVFNISVIQLAVRDRKQELLFLHAITGYGDITSALYR